jgi:uncharacterized BrkB/YihY/UPF0761 family membrane protein
VTTTIIFLFGLLTVLLSLTVAIKFRNQSLKAVAEDSAKLSSAWQLVGEAVLGLGTLVFATAAHFEVLPEWSTETQSAIRGVMFAAAGATTLHLYLTISRLR